MQYLFADKTSNHINEEISYKLVVKATILPSLKSDNL